jgi:hypothetical protein
MMPMKAETPAMRPNQQTLSSVRAYVVVGVCALALFAYLLAR